MTLFPTVKCRHFELPELCKRFMTSKIVCNVEYVYVVILSCEISAAVVAGEEIIIYGYHDISVLLPLTGILTLTRRN